MGLNLFVKLIKRGNKRFWFDPKKRLFLATELVGISLVIRPLLRKARSMGCCPHSPLSLPFWHRTVRQRKSDKMLCARFPKMTVQWLSYGRKLSTESVDRQWSRASLPNLLSSGSVKRNQSLNNPFHYFWPSVLSSMWKRSKERSLGGFVPGALRAV